MKNPSEILNKLIQEFDNNDHEIYKAIEYKFYDDSYHDLSELQKSEVGDIDIEYNLSLVISCFAKITDILRECYETIKTNEEDLEKELGSRNLEFKSAKLKTVEYLTAIAENLDKSGDPELRKEADVLDNVVLHTIAYNAEYEKLREKHKTPVDELYSKPVVNVKKSEEIHKKILDNLPENKMNFAPLSNRTCPDHPGAQMIRIADSVVQCSLDGKVYDYKTGFSTITGNKVPGGAIEHQTDYNQLSGHATFNTRESRLQENIK